MEFDRILFRFEGFIPNYDLFNLDEEHIFRSMWQRPYCYDCEKGKLLRKNSGENKRNGHQESHEILYFQHLPQSKFLTA